MKIPKDCPMCGKALNPLTMVTAVAKWGGFLVNAIMALRGKPVRMNPSALAAAGYKCGLCGKPRF